MVVILHILLSLFVSTTQIQIAHANYSCIKTGAPESQQQYVRMAWDISHDLNFLALIEAESEAWTPDRKSIAVGSNGYRDRGFCQINPGWHPHIVFDKRFSNPRWQLEQCYRLWKEGTTFYGAANIDKTIKLFTCSYYARPTS